MPPPDSPRDPSSPDPTSRPPPEPATAAASRLDPFQERFVAALRDECGDIGVSARGFDLDGFVNGVADFAREARRLGEPPERMLVLLKQCLSDERLPLDDRDVYQLYVSRAVTTAIAAYYETATGRAAAPDTDGRPRG